MRSCASATNAVLTGSGSKNPLFMGGTRATGLLEKLSPQESSGKENKPVIETNKTVARLEKIFGKYLTQKPLADLYMKALECVAGIKFTAKDVELLSLALAKYENVRDFCSRAGYFLSALINSSESAEFVIHTNQLRKKIDNIGCWNSGKTILVKGDAGTDTGFLMADGKIVVEGNTFDCTGFQMNGGKICVSGQIREISIHIKNGEIWQGDRQLVKGGRIIAEPVNK